MTIRLVLNALTRIYPLPEPGVLITWIVTACTAVGLIRFMERVILPGNNTGIAVVMMGLPTGIVVTAALGMLVSLGRFFIARRTRELPWWFPV
jgi:hypothetical protein